MSFLDMLRKLGILRYGSNSYTYHSAKDMPAAAIMDDVYDEKKDLLGGQASTRDPDGKDGSKN